MNCLYKGSYCTVFNIEDLNAHNRILTVYFALRIDWYTNKGQISNTMNKRIDVSLQSAASGTVSVVFMN